MNRECGVEIEKYTSIRFYGVRKKHYPVNLKCLTAMKFLYGFFLNWFIHSMIVMFSIKADYFPCPLTVEVLLLVNNWEHALR